MKRAAWAVAAGIALAGCSSSGHPAASHRPGVSQTPSAAATTPTAPVTRAPTTTPTPSGAPASRAFRATDVTFVSVGIGWAIGPDGLVRTTDGGATWQRLPANLVHVTHLRFANATTGYAWRPFHPLMLTTDGGSTWRSGGLPEMVDLEVSGSNAWALVGPEPGGYVWHSTVGTTTWTKLGIEPNRGSTLDVRGSLAYVTGQQGAGPVAPLLDVWSADGSMRQERLPCVRPHRLVVWSPLGVSTDGSLVLDCDVEEPRPAHQLFYVSRDEGRTWTQAAAPPTTPDDVTAIPGARFSFGTGIYADTGNGWQPVLAPVAGRAFAVAGFEDGTHGVALTRHGTLFRTVDGGRTWTVARI